MAVRFNSHQANFYLVSFRSLTFCVRKFYIQMLLHQIQLGLVFKYPWFFYFLFVRCSRCFFFKNSTFNFCSIKVFLILRMLLTKQRLALNYRTGIIMRKLRSFNKEHWTPQLPFSLFNFHQIARVYSIQYQGKYSRNIPCLFACHFRFLFFCSCCFFLILCFRYLICSHTSQKERQQTHFRLFRGNWKLLCKLAYNLFCFASCYTEEFFV